MNYILIGLKLIVGLSILNVWVINPKKATKWRGGNATNIVEEFHLYGLPTWFCFFVGFLKISLAVLLIASIWFPRVQEIASLGLAVLLLGSIIMHFRVKDALYKSYPAFIFMIMCLVIASSTHIYLTL
ncbi:DoxX family protein [Aquimarina spongiae]|uniref:DoxX-like family protein n=1 Tax=Aquimarina spongiae TaxID=570521 RepID=A0A1M6GNW2_9FLAO|nr:DoxX family protein [Aquimarina spongiae]SHJ11675.1 DoxX-like family protein [Aquimarina spongiae]